MNNTPLGLKEQMIAQLEKTMPGVFARKDIKLFLGSTISTGTLANVTCEGYGPPCVRSGRNAIYEKETFLQWFKVYLEGGIKAVEKVYKQRE